MALAQEINLDTGVENAWSAFMEAVPKVIAFLVILLVGFLIAKAIGKAVTTLLRKVNFDNFVQRGAVRHAMAKSSFEASQLAGKLAYYAAALLTLVFAFGVFGGDNPVSRLLAGVMAFIPKLVVAIVIVLVAAAIAGWVKDIVSNALGGLAYGGLLGTLASGAILVTGIFMALDQLLIAPAIVTGLYYAVLAAIVGVTVVAVGGGGIQPMRARWERALNTVDTEGPRLKEEARAAKARRAAQAAQQAAYAAAPQYGQDFTGQPYPAQQQSVVQPDATGARSATASATPLLPPAAYTADQPRALPDLPADATIDLTQEELQRQAARGAIPPPPGAGPQPPAPPAPR